VEAKRAAGGDSSPPSRLPAFLRKPSLPHNAAALKQQLNAMLKHRWSSRWHASPRFLRAKRLMKSYPSPSSPFSKAVSLLSRHRLSILTQMLSNHIPLNFFLHRIGKVASPCCPHCPTEVESLAHFVLSCPHYAQPRFHLRSKLRRSAHSLESMLADTNAFSPLLDFVLSSKRLDDLPGNVAQVA
jgi:hypothetical protein